MKREMPNLPSNFRQLCRDAKQKLISFGYKEGMAAMSDGPLHPESKFGVYYSKWDDNLQKNVGSTWLNFQTVSAIVEAKDESEVPQLAHI